MQVKDIYHLLYHKLVFIHFSEIFYSRNCQSKYINVKCSFNSKYGCPTSSDACGALALEPEIGGAPVFSYGITSNISTALNNCESTSFVSPAKFYSVTIPANTIITASTCSSNTKFDTFVSIFSGDCMNPTCEAYNDNDPSCNQIHQSKVSKAMLQGGTYYISVSSKDGSSGNINLKFIIFY